MVGADPKADRAYSEFGLEVPSGTVMLISQFRDAQYFQDEIIAKEEQVIRLKVSLDWN